MILGFHLLRKSLCRLEVLLESDAAEEERVGDDLHTPFHVLAMDLVYRGFNELPGRAVCLPSLAGLEVLD